MSLFADIIPHIRVPTMEDKIFKDECAFSFDTPELEHGVYICLSSFVAVGHAYLETYSNLTGHRAFLQYKIEKRFTPKEKNTSEPPTKLAIGVPGGFDLPQERYTITEQWFLVQMPEREPLELPLPKPGQSSSDVSHLEFLDLPHELASCITAVQCSDSAILAEERAAATAAWEDENICIISVHAMNLVQLDNDVRIPPSGWKCAKCGLKENLWLNLTDGMILCGRRFWDGSGGNNHAMEHYAEVKYPLAVKLGTITPKGGEVFSYAEDAMVTDPLLSEHLAHFGIDIMLMEKTDKTMAEMEVAANERLGEWLTLQEANYNLQPRSGPGLTGLRNLGNSCYMNSVMQVLFAIPKFRSFYAYKLPCWSKDALSLANTVSPVDHVGLQMAKLGQGLCSGAHSWSVTEESTRVMEGPVPLSPGIRPLLFRRLIGRNHVEFVTKRQQDAFEFMVHLMSLLEGQAVADSQQSARQPTPVAAMQVLVEDRLECGSTHKVRYSSNTDYALSLPVPMEAAINKDEVITYEARQAEAEASGTKLLPEDIVRPRIPLEACLSAWAATERIEEFASPATVPPGQKTFALRSSRLLNFPDYLCLRISKFALGSDWLPRKLDVEIDLGPGLAESTTAQPKFRFDLSALRAPGGLRTGETAMPEDKPTDRPASHAPVVSELEPNSDLLSQLMEMGFSAVACIKACVQTKNQGIEAATNWLMEHMDDYNLNTPMENDVSETTATSATLPAHSGMAPPDEDAVVMLTAMGFSRGQALNALAYNNNQLEAAADWLLVNPDAPPMEPIRYGDAGSRAVAVAASTVSSDASTNNRVRLTDGQPVYELFGFISHMGKSTTTGHYVAHIKRSALSHGLSGNEEGRRVLASSEGANQSTNDDEWIIFNDEKVAKSEAPPHSHAYLYFLCRVDAPKE